MCVKDWWNLWQKRKGLALAVLAFVLGQAYFSFKGVETFPWLHFGMFSAPYQSPPEYLDLEQGLHSVLKELPAKTRVCGAKRQILVAAPPKRNSAKPCSRSHRAAFSFGKVSTSTRIIA